jgi:hypothetical protein
MPIRRTSIDAATVCRTDDGGCLESFIYIAKAIHYL